MIINKEILEEKGACTPGRNWYLNNFGNVDTYVWDVVEELKKQKDWKGYIKWLFINFKLTGTCEGWHLGGGKLKYRITYVDGKIDGVFESWAENGTRTYLTNYRNDIEHGLMEWWYVNGKLRMRSNFRDGELHGISEWWDMNGKLTYVCYHSHDKEIVSSKSAIIGPIFKILYYMYIR